MNGMRIAGAVWLVAGVFAIATTLIFRTDAVQWLVTMAIGAIALILGFWLVSRPQALAVSASNVLAVVWTMVYAVLVVQQSDEVAAWTTDIALVAVGVAAGLVAYRGAARANLRGSMS